VFQLIRSWSAATCATRSRAFYERYRRNRIIWSARRPFPYAVSSVRDSRDPRETAGPTWTFDESKVAACSGASDEPGSDNSAADSCGASEFIRACACESRTTRSTAIRNEFARNSAPIGSRGRAFRREERSLATNAHSRGAYNQSRDIVLHTRCIIARIPTMETRGAVALASPSRARACGAASERE